MYHQMNEINLPMACASYWCCSLTICVRYMKSAVGNIMHLLQEYEGCNNTNNVVIKDAITRWGMGGGCGRVGDRGRGVIYFNCSVVTY
jgi:hypothetical protein